MILALMAKKPAERLATGDLVVELIDETLDALDGAGSDNAESSAKKPRQRRKTSSTKKDRPPIPIPRSALEPLPIDPVPVGRPTSRARWMAVGAALAFGLSVGGVLAVRFITGAPGATASADDNHDPVASEARREIFRDDGETRLRAWVPDPFVVGRARLRIELRNKLGSPIVADQMIVTVEDPSGMATAVTTRPRQEDPNQFGFVFEYKTPGTYHMRVFPPEDVARSPSTFSIPLDVVAK